MPQANSRSIISSPPRSLLKRAVDIFADARRLIAPSVFRDEPHAWTILVPVRDDRFSPALRCGEFAVVDQNEDWPTMGACYWVRFAKSRDVTVQGAFLFVGEPNEWEIYGKPSGLHYRVNYGLANVRTLDLRPDPEFAGLCMGDNIPSDHLRNLIVGRVVGVLGDGERSINWRMHNVKG